MKFKNYLKTEIYKLIESCWIFPFPIIDRLPDDICEYLKIDKAKFMESIKTRSHKKNFNDYKEDYDKWLKESNYYFYDLCRWHLQEKFSLSLEFIFQPKNLKILDFGSGIGTRSLICSKKNAMTLVEINKKLLDFSKWRFKKFHREGEFYLQIPEDKTYDMVMLFDVIGHLMKPIEIISQICSSLKKNGILKVTFDNFYETSLDDRHRNREIDFPKLFRENGLIKIDSMHYKKF